MGKKDIIRILKNYKREFANRYSILTIEIFGSVARDEAGDESDVEKPCLFESTLVTILLVPFMSFSSYNSPAPHFHVQLYGGSEIKNLSTTV